VSSPPSVRGGKSFVIVAMANHNAQSEEHGIHRYPVSNRLFKILDGQPKTVAMEVI
jgi:hypothetical protein